MRDFETVKRLCVNGTDCKFNKGVICIGEPCEKCGWCPAVEEQRKKVNVKKYAKKSHRKTRSRKVYGSTFNMERLTSVTSVISVMVTADEQGKSLSVADDKLGVMFTIPLEPVSDMLKIVEG